MRSLFLLCVAAISTASFAGAGLPRPGYFAVEKSRIVDSKGATPRLVGVNWFGFETATRAPHGLWARSYRELLDLVKNLGFTFVRLPFSNDIFDPSKTPNGIDFSKNPELAGKTSLQILDRILAYARQLGLKVLLDRHRPTEVRQTELWFGDGVSEEKWIADWITLVRRYRRNDTVFAVDLHNEPHGSATWGDGSPYDWRLAAERAGNAILSVHSDLLIVVQGVETVNGDSTWWGGNLLRAGTLPVRLRVEGRVVYSPHDYPPSIFEQPWFSHPNYPNNLPSVWRTYWGYLVEGGIAPVLLGEFGTKLATPRDEQWLRALVDYLRTTGIPAAFWSLNPNSGDTGGLLENDWRTLDSRKLEFLAPLLR